MWLKKTLAILIIFALVNASQAISSNITILKPEKLNFIFERNIQPGEDLNFIPKTDTQNINEKNYINLAISTNLLFSEENKIPIYDCPENNSQKIGWFAFPQKVEVIRISGNYAKVKLGENQAGWILKRNIACADFESKYKERCFSSEELMPILPEIVTGNKEEINFSEQITISKQITINGEDKEL